MSSPRTRPKAAKVVTITREDAISRIRGILLQSVDEETSVCKAAAEHGVFCRGFRQFSDRELRARYDWIVAKRPGMTRDELETIANDWQLAQQTVNDIGFACDVQSKLHDTCNGWDDFTNEQLAATVLQLTGKQINVS